MGGGGGLARVPAKQGLEVLSPGDERVCSGQHTFYTYTQTQTHGASHTHTYTAPVVCLLWSQQFKQLTGGGGGPALQSNTK